MNTDKQPVAPVEGHYAMLRNGMVVGPLAKEWPQDELTSFSIAWEHLEWKQDGTGHGMLPAWDIIATISPEAMALAANGGLEALEAELGQCNQDNGDWTYENQLLKAKVAELIALADAVCDYADAKCRAFPIESVPDVGGFLAWSTVELGWIQFDGVTEFEYFKTFGNRHFTHWRPLPPPPSTDPLPAVFTDLGAALERLKEATSR
jgi:hypothetical protein